MATSAAIDFRSFGFFLSLASNASAFPFMVVHSVGYASELLRGCKAAYDAEPESSLLLKRTKVIPATINAINTNAQVDLFFMLIYFNNSPTVVGLLFFLHY